MKVFRSYLQIVKPYKWLIGWTILIGVIKFSIPLTLPLFIKYVVDNVLLAPISAHDKYEKLLKAVGLAFLLFVVVRYPINIFDNILRSSQQAAFCLI